MAQNRPQKPVVIVRRAYTPQRKASWQIPPALISAVALAAVGGVGWWLLQPGPSTSGVPDEEVSSEVTGAPAGAEAQADSPVVASAAPAAVAVPAEAVVPANEMPAAPEPMEPTEADTPPDFSRVLALDNMGGAKKENEAWAAEAWRLAKTKGAWNEYRDLLARSLQAFAARGVDAAAIASGKYSGPALVRHAFLTAVPGDLLDSLMEDEENEETAGFLTELMENTEAMQAFVLQVTPQDDVEKALTLWAKLAAENPSAMKEYVELAVACALVFDEKVQAAKDRYEKEVTGTQRFDYFASNDAAGRLTAQIKQMTAADLVWVVGVPISTKELEWALKEADFRRKSWGNAYGSIKYDMEKAVSGKDSYDEYTFAEIQKKGGICSDQSYFTAWTACAHGVPAAIITGDGDRGPHAWITWQSDDSEWKFSGRFAGYPAGRTRHPQTRETISEEEFLRLSDRKASDPDKVRRAKQAMWAAQVFASQPGRALPLLTEAVKEAPLLADPAAALLAHWKEHRASAPVQEWVALLKDLRKDFRDSAPLMELAGDLETEFVFSRQDTAATMKDLRREGKKVGETAGEGTGVAVDLERLTSSLKRQAEAMQTAKNPDGIRFLYRRALDEYGDDAATFKALAKTYFDFFKDDPLMAVKTSRELEMACRRSVGRGKGDWFDVVSQNSAWRVVAECYRAAGDEAKWKRIVKDCDDRESSAKKRAI